MTAPFIPELDVSEIQNLLPKYKDIVAYAQGGQGTVFRGISQMGVPVAIKIYSPDQTLTRAELEVKKLQKVQSPYMVTLIESGYLTVRRKQAFYSITRFEHGKDLRRILNDHGALSESEVGILIMDICNAIDELWKAKVVHCDIKPDNVLQGADGHFLLIDLGLAKHLDARTITQYGLTMGTLGYMAPEQMVGRRNYTLRVDLFALGIVAYEALTGVHPFGNNQMLIGSRDTKIAPISSLINVDRNLERVIMRLLQWNVLMRPKSGIDVINMIRR